MFKSICNSLHQALKATWGRSCTLGHTEPLVKAGRRTKRCQRDRVWMNSILKKSRSKIEGAEDFSFAQRFKNPIYARDGKVSHYSDATQPFIIDGDTYVSIFLGTTTKGEAHGEEER